MTLKEFRHLMFLCIYWNTVFTRLRSGLRDSNLPFPLFFPLLCSIHLCKFTCVLVHINVNMCITLNIALVFLHIIADIFKWIGKSPTQREDISALWLYSFTWAVSFSCTLICVPEVEKGAQCHRVSFGMYCWFWVMLAWWHLLCALCTCSHPISSCV